MQRPWYVRLLGCLPLRAALVVTVILAATVFISLHLIIVPVERARMKEKSAEEAGLSLEMMNAIRSHHKKGGVGVDLPRYENSYRVANLSKNLPLKSVSKVSRPTVKRLISAKIAGRLGNSLFLYASLLGLARWTSRTAVLPAGHHLREDLKAVSADMSPPAVNSEVWVRFTESQSCAFDERALRLNDESQQTQTSSADMLHIIGYFQSWQYFEHVKDEIRAEFVFNSVHREAAELIINEIIEERFGEGTRRSDVILIGVHVRRGDMGSEESYQLGYTTATAQYIHNAINYFISVFSQNSVVSRKEKDGESAHRNVGGDGSAPGNFKDDAGSAPKNERGGRPAPRKKGSRGSGRGKRHLLFVIASDDREWCEKHINLTEDIVLLPANSKDIVDLTLLSSCDHVIMTVGSFGWWAAWLAGGKVIYYKDFPRPNSYLASQFRKSEYFYPGWIGM